MHQDTLGRLLKTAQQLQVKGLIEQSGAGGGARAGEGVQVGSVSSGPATLVTVVIGCESSPISRNVRSSVSQLVS